LISTFLGDLLRILAYNVDSSMHCDERAKLSLFKKALEKSLA
jgi:hypothetical protein